MKFFSPSRKSGFTLIETVIAIGVLAVLLTGFMIVFAPAAEGIRKSINVQQADRMATTVEQELVTLRGTQSATFRTGFNKAYEWIKKSNTAGDALMVYQYRSKVGGATRADGTPDPLTDLRGKLPGKDYMVVPMARLKSDPEFIKDLAALEGAVYLVKATQLVFTAGELVLGTPGAIKDPKGVSPPGTSGDDYPEAVIAFAAEFHLMPSRSKDYFSGSAYTSKFPNLKNPVFTRNLAVRR